MPTVDKNMEELLGLITPAPAPGPAAQPPPAAPPVAPPAAPATPQPPAATPNVPVATPPTATAAVPAATTAATTAATGSTAANEARRRQQQLQQAHRAQLLIQQRQQAHARAQAQGQAAPSAQAQAQAQAQARAQAQAMARARIARPKSETSGASSGAPAVPVAHRGPAAATTQIDTNTNSNLTDLLNLLGTNGATAPAGAQTPTAPRAATIPNAPDLSAQQQRAGAARSAQAVTAASLAAPRGMPPTASTAAARGPVSNDITAELDGMMGRTAGTTGNTPSSHEHAAAVAAQSAQAAAFANNPAALAAARQAAAQRANNGVSVNGAAGGVAAAARRPPGQVTQEQVVVGHFCRHAIKTLGRVMRGKPSKEAKEEELKAVIKNLWTQWVRGVISKTALRQRVSEFVRTSTPEASNIDVTGEFRQWYQHQLQIQAMSGRNSAAGAGGQARSRTQSDAAELAKRSAAMQANLSHAKNPALMAAANGAAVRSGVGTAGVHGQGGAAAAVANAASLAAQRQGLPSTETGVGMKRPLPLSASGSMTSIPGVAMRQVTTLNAHAAAAANMNVPSATGAPPAKKPRPGPKKKVGKGGQAQTPTGQAAVAKQGFYAKSTGQAAPQAGPGGGVAGSQPGRSGPGPSAPGEVPKKAARKVDDELDIVRNIIDIEGEEDMLVGSDGVGGAAVDTADYDAAGLILTGPALKAKLGAVCSRLGLDENVPSETMEIVALAVRQRLAHVLEQMGNIAKARVGADLAGWNTKPVGVDQKARMQEQRDQELRTLDAAANVRREKAASAAAKLAAENTAEADKAAKEAAASADAKKKEQALKEKQQMAQKTQRNALFEVMGRIGKKSRSKGDQGSSSRKPSGGKTGGSSDHGNSSKDNHASPAPGGAATSKGGGGASGSDGRAHNTVQDSSGPKGKANGGTGYGTADGLPGHAGSAANLRPPITLRDCLHFMEGEPRMRKSALLYVWYTRLGVDKPQPPASGRK